MTPDSPGRKRPAGGVTALKSRLGDLRQAAALPGADLASLLDAALAELDTAIDALAQGGPVSCPDTLAEDRWPEYAEAGLRCGVRCSVTLVYLSGAGAVTLSLFGARPHALESGQLTLAELLTAVGGALMGNAAEYGDARRTALQLSAGAESRALVDQAKGMLMQVLGCSAEDALDKMRQISQEENLRVTDIAQRIIDSRGTGGLGPARAQRRRRDARAARPNVPDKA